MQQLQSKQTFYAVLLPPPHLFASHQEEVDSSDVDADALTEILEDLPYE